MNVHVIRSPFFSEDDYTQIVNVLKSKPGPLTFKEATQKSQYNLWDYLFEVIKESMDDDIPVDSELDLSQYEVSMGWDFLFHLCGLYRKENNISDKDFIVLLTPHYNPENWFTSFSNDSNDIFVHTKEWDYYLDCKPIYPVTYLVMSQVVQKILYRTVDEKVAHAHSKTRACMNDFCGDKSDISFKLRTADICRECLNKLPADNKFNTLITQAFSLFEEVKKELLNKQHLKIKPSRLHITEGNEIILLDYLDKKIELGPLDKTAFFFYLKHPDGVHNQDIHQYRDEIESIYELLNIYTPTVSAVVINALKKKLKGMGSNVLELEIEREYNKAEAKFQKEFDESVSALANRLHNSMSEKRSHIKTEFENKIGEDAASYYIIIGAKNKPYKINLDRSLVTCDSGILGPDYLPKLPDQEELTLA